MFEILLTLSQAFQMMTLAPCILVIVYLIASSNSHSFIVIPTLYFLSLGCGIILPLLPVFIPLEKSDTILTLITFGESFSTALLYLFIVQLILNRYPGFIHYLILAVPALGGSSYIYASQISEEICLVNICLASSYAVIYYNIFSSAVIFMLLIIFNSRLSQDTTAGEVQKKHKYWLILSLILFNLMLLALDLWKVSSDMKEPAYIFAQSAIRLGFIYIVMTSIFRVFTEIFYEKMPVIRKTTLSDSETDIAKKIEKLMMQEKLYTDLNLSRAKFASLLEIKEHQLSNIIALAFKKSFSEFINYYRIEEAKRLLKESQQPITVISFDTGFNSLTSFNRVFKEVTNLSPSDFRAGK